MRIIYHCSLSPTFIENLTTAIGDIQISVTGRLSFWTGNDDMIAMVTLLNSLWFVDMLLGILRTASLQYY